MKSLLIMDGLARLCLLLPVYLTGRSLGSIVGCLVIGLLGWLWFSVLLARACGDQMQSGNTHAENGQKQERDFFARIGSLCGGGCAWIVYLIGFFYFLAHTAVFMNLCAELAGTYLLPDVPVPVLAVLPLAAGLYLAYSGIEVRGRVSELLTPFLLVLFLVMVSVAAYGLRLQPGEEMQLRADNRLMTGSYEVFASLGGMFLPILTAFLSQAEGHDGKRTPDVGKILRRAACWSLIPAGILLFLTAASFGTRGMMAFKFPQIRVMSNVTVPGGFIQRWDVFFLALLLFSLAITVGSGFWYMNLILERLWKEVKEQRYVFAEARRREAEQSAMRTNSSEWETEIAAELTGLEIDERMREDCWEEEIRKAYAGKERADSLDYGLYLLQGIAVFVAFCAAGGFLNAETAISYYRALNLYLLTPVMFLFYFILYFRGRQKKKELTALLLFICLILTGCTAKELEDRMFPMALEMRVEGEEIAMTYAWNGENASGSGGGEKTDAGDDEEESGTEQAESSFGTEPESSDSDKNAEIENGDPETEYDMGEGSGGQSAEHNADGGTGEMEGKRTAEMNDDASERRLEREMEYGNQEMQGRITGGTIIKSMEAGGTEQGTEPEISREPEEQGNLTVFRGRTLAEIQKQVEAYSDRYMDYSHVKALILDERLEQYPELEQEIYEWLTGDPAFAASLIIYPAQKSGLSLEKVDRRSDGETGIYLENLYQNNRTVRESAATLGEMAAKYYENQ